MPIISDEFFHQALEALPATGRVPLDIAMSVEFDNRIDAGKGDKLTYFTGKPCRQGHLSDRYTSTGNCTECQREASLKAYQKARFGDVPEGDFPAIPECIAGKGEAKMLPCMTCPRMNDGCKGSQYSRVGNRAVMAFPDYPPLPRAIAKKRGYRVFMPSRACPQCGVRAWRTVREDKCCACGAK